LKNNIARHSQRTIHSEGYPRIIGEVEADYLSAGKPQYGASQKKELKKDIDGLLNGKHKTPVTETDLKDSYLFLCQIDLGDISIKAEIAIIIGVIIANVA
jgi:hypothetical protein